MKKQFDYDLKIGETVKHVTPGSPEGVISNVVFDVKLSTPTYYVLWAYNDERTHFRSELIRANNEPNVGFKK